MMSKNSQRFLIFLALGLLALVLIFLATLLFGAETYSFSTVKDAFFAFSMDDFSHLAIRNIRLPRWWADVIVGASLSIAGAIMQGTTKNPMADSGIMGISSGATLGVVIVMAYFPAAGRYEKMGISALGAALITLLIYAIAFLGRGKLTSERMVLSGMAISTLLSSLTTSIILKYGLSNQMIRYTSGSSANTIWTDIYLALPFFLVAVMLAIIISRYLTVMNLGEEVSKGLGVNLALARFVATLIVLVLSAVAVIIIGPVSYVGLMIPYASRYMAGTDYRLTLPLSALYGAVFVTGVDLVAKLIHPGLEFPIGLLITIIGVPFFVYISQKQEGGWS